MHRTIAHFKSKIKPSRYEHSTDNEKNHGYLVVESPNSDVVVFANDDLEQLTTRRAQSCVQINEVHFDPNQIQCESDATMTPSVSPLPQSMLGLSRIHGGKRSMTFGRLNIASSLCHSSRIERRFETSIHTIGHRMCGIWS